MFIFEQILKSLDILEEMHKYRGNDTSDFRKLTQLELSSIVDKNKVHDNVSNTFDIVLSENIKVIFVLNRFNKTAFGEVLKKNMKPLTILIYKGQLTPKYKSDVALFARELSQNEDTKNFGIEIFSLMELQMNISKSMAVSQHEIVPAGDVVQLLKDYKCKNKTQFNIIKSDDAMARFIGAKTGDIVKITSNSITSVEYISYRTCV